MNILLLGERLYLRRLKVDDVSLKYVGWLNDPEVSQYLETRFYQQSYEAVVNFVSDKQYSTTEYLFGIFLNEDDTHIGNIKLGPVNPFHSFGPISLFIGDKSCWGKGYATEAIRLIVDFGFKELSLQKLEAGCYEENIGSKRAFEKAGFLVEGILRNQRCAKNGRTSDIVMGMLREEWCAG